MYPTTYRRFLFSSNIFPFFLIVFIIFQSSIVKSCGPGRGYGRRRVVRPLTPLVFKQHLPNVAEETIMASGAPEGRITRTDPRFTHLVRLENDDIVFKDEEKTGEGRIMTQRCRDMLLALSSAVMNEWSGEVRLRVVEAWDGEGWKHSGDSLHLEGRAVDITTSDRDRSKYGLLARLAVEVGFDWVYYESRSHVHCSVKAESSVLLKHGGCFSANATVIDNSGSPKKMADVIVGDRVLTYDIISGKTSYDDVIAFLHRDVNATSADFLSIDTESGRRLELTSGHMVFKSSQKPGGSLQATVAGRLRAGNYVMSATSSVMLLAESHVTIVADKIVRITKVKQAIVGIYAPLTTSGTLIVDGVVTSCYASFTNHHMAHAVMAPLRLAHYVTGNGRRENSSEIPREYDVSGIHWYALMLIKLAEYLQPGNNDWGWYD